MDETHDITPGSGIAASIDRTAAAQASWEELGVAGRAALIRQLRYRIAETQDELLAILVEETGKPVFEVANQEITAALAMMRFLEKKYPAWLEGRRFRSCQPGFWMKRHRLVYDPIGVVGVIGPANFPFSLIAMQTCAALMCGNTVVLKPSECCPGVAGYLRGLFEEVLPSSVVAVVEGNSAAAESVIVHEAVRKIVFTGSTEAGRRVAALCGLHFKPCVLELGGEGAALVCDDADLPRTARALIWSAAYANGNSCIGARRVFVTAKTRQALHDVLQHELARVRLGDPTDAATDVSVGLDLRLASNTFEKVEPTALHICEVGSMDEAVEAVNRSAFGLSASVWSGDEKAALRLAHRLCVGMVWINDASVALPDYPWGGVRASGWGRLYAREALPELTNLKVISRQRKAGARFWRYPYTAKKLEAVRALNAFEFGKRSLRNSVRLVRALLGLIVRKSG